MGCIQILDSFFEKLDTSPSAPKATSLNRLNGDIDLDIEGKLVLSDDHGSRLRHGHGLLLVQAGLGDLHLDVQRDGHFVATFSSCFGFLFHLQVGERLLLLVEVLGWEAFAVLGVLGLLSLLLVELDDLGNSVLVLRVLGLLDLLLSDSLTVCGCSFELNLSVFSLEFSLGFTECIALAVVFLA